MRTGSVGKHHGDIGTGAETQGGKVGSLGTGLPTEDLTGDGDGRLEVVDRGRVGAGRVTELGGREVLGGGQGDLATGEGVDDAVAEFIALARTGTANEGVGATRGL